MRKLSSILTICIVIASTLRVKCEDISKTLTLEDATDGTSGTNHPSEELASGAFDTSADSSESDDPSKQLSDGSIPNNDLGPSEASDATMAEHNLWPRKMVMRGRMLFDKCYRNPHENGSCPYEVITFWLYTRANKDGIEVTKENLDRLPIDKDKPWKIVFHGYNSSKEGPGEVLKNAYLNRGYYNVLVLDYAQPMHGIVGWCYLNDISVNIDLVARCSADFLHQMIKTGVLPKPSQLHMIGHSLGAHIAAAASVHLTEMTKEKVDRITGLDPAGVLINSLITNASRRLDQTDAKFVDAHHTNHGWIAAGTWENVGTVDIWYNYVTILSRITKEQPGCSSEIGTRFEKFMTTEECSHRRAIGYFAESISPIPPYYHQFVGKDAYYDQYVIGEDVPRDENEPDGDLYVYTNPKAPFARDRMIVIRKLGVINKRNKHKPARNQTSRLEELKKLEAVMRKSNATMSPVSLL